MKSIKEIKELPDDCPVEEVRGTLVKLFQPKRGDGQYGMWVFQSGALQDEAGDELRVNFKFEVDRNLENKPIIIRAGAKGGKPFGLKKVTDKWRNKETGEPVEKLAVEVGRTCSVKVDDGEDQVPMDFDKDGKAVPTPTTPAPKPPADSLETCKREIHLLANAYELCLARAALTRELFEALCGEQMPFEMLQSETASLFIAITRNGKHLGLPVDIKPHIKGLTKE